MNILNSIQSVRTRVVFVCRNSPFIDMISLVPLSLYRIACAFIPNHSVKSSDSLIKREIAFIGRYKNIIEVSLNRDFIKAILGFLKTTEAIEGNVIELGSYKGGSSLVIGRFLKYSESNKRFFACDTFRGHPYDDAFGGDLKSRFDDTNVQHIRIKFSRFNVINHVTMVVGPFEETLFSQLENHKFSFAFLDCDLYQSSVIALRFLAKRMNKNAIIAIHDYGDPHFGISKAVHEFCGRTGNKVSLYPIPHLIIR